MSRLTSQPVKTFSVGFRDADFSELAPARQVAALFGTEHHELVLEPDVVPLVEDFAWFLDEPFGDTSAIATYMVSKLAAEHVKVVLTGDGGDELFAGYDKYVVEDRERAYDLDARVAAARRGRGRRGDARGHARPAVPPAPRARRAAALPRRAVDRRTPTRWTRCSRPRRRRAWRRYDPWTAPMAHLRRRRRTGCRRCSTATCRRYLPLDVLTKVDRMTMAHSIEARPPLLDHRLVEFAATIPPRLRYRDGTTKYLFKQALRGVLPDAIIDRRKQGFAVPLARWFRGPLLGFARDVLLSASSRERGVLEPGRGRAPAAAAPAAAATSTCSCGRCSRSSCGAGGSSTAEAVGVMTAAPRPRIAIVAAEPRHPRRPGRAGAQRWSRRCARDGYPVAFVADQPALSARPALAAADAVPAHAR